jgi:hypothetical protein
MNDDRIEQLLRDWLSAEDAAMEVPARMLTAAASARASAAPVSTLRGRLTWPRGASLAAGAVVVALAILLSVTLAGVLPLGRPNCSGVTIEAVRAAVKDIPGYSWHMTGTELLNHPGGLDENNQMTFEYSTAELEFAGAYLAPSTWRIDVLHGYDPTSVANPSIGLLVTDEWDGYLVVDGQAWVRPFAATQYQAAGAAADLQLHRWANQLYGLLFGEPFLIEYEHGTPWGQDLSWVVSSQNAACRLTGTGHLEAAPAGYSHVVEFLVHPGSLLPESGSWRLVNPSTAASSPGSGASPDREWNLRFTYDFGTLPVIADPAAAS